MSDTGPAKLPGIPVLQTDDPALAKWAAAVTEYLQVRAGARGNPLEAAVTKRDLKNLGLTSDSTTVVVKDQTSGSSSGGLPVTLSNGQKATLPLAVFLDAIRGSDLYAALLAKLDDPNRFSQLPLAVQQIVNVAVAEEARKRGAAITSAQTIVQNSVDSLAVRVDEVTAAASNAESGVREVAYAYATASHAIAGTVSDITARLDDFNGGSATIETVATAIADSITGLSAQYTLKVNAGGHFAGVGLAATSSTAGVGTSAIILVAEKFALIGPSETIADPTNPPTDRVPFGYDSGTDTLYLTGNIRINAGGSTLAQGLRGSLSASVDGSSWSDTTARNAIWTLLGNGGTPSDNKHLVIGDTVSIWHSTTFAQTKMWLGSSWGVPGVVLTGDMMVDGGISARTMAAGSITAANAALDTACVTTLKIAGNQVTVPSTTSYTGPYNGGGSPLVISTSITLAEAGVIEAFGTLEQGWTSGFVGWQVNLTIDGTTVFDTGTVAGGAFQQAVAVSGALSVGAGSHTVYLNWVGATSGVQLGTANIVALGAMR